MIVTPAVCPPLFLSLIVVIVTPAVYPRVFENFQKCHVWVIFNINFLSSNEVLDIQDKVQFFLKKNFRSGLVNTLSAGPFFWKSRIFRNFFRFLKCSNSVNFEGRRNLNPFLEFLKALLSNAHAWRGVPLTKNCKTNLTQTNLISNYFENFQKFHLCGQFQYLWIFQSTNNF